MKSTTDIQELLLKEMKELASGKGDISKAKAMAELSAQAIYVTRVELENKRLELELGRSNEEVKKWMDKDFSKIQNIKVGETK